MAVDQKLDDEAGRLAALYRYEVLDTPRETPFDRVTGLVSQVLNVPMCAVSLVDTDRQWFKSCVGLSTAETGRDISFCTHTILQREPLSICDATLDARFAQNPLVTGSPFIRSYLGVPLTTPDGYNLGSLCVIDVVPRNFRPEQVEILKSFAAVVVDELELRRIAQTDHLTGAMTRRGFIRELDKAFARFRRSAHPTALVLLDIDHFKRVNDTFGHPTGDEVLKAVALDITSQLRVSDSLGRWGGEEFGVLLQDIESEQVLATAERLRRHIELLVVDNEPGLQVTASLGVATLDSHMASVEAWLAVADAALYEAKRAGRNRSAVGRVS